MKGFDKDAAFKRKCKKEHLRTSFAIIALASSHIFLSLFIYNLA